VWRDRAYFIMMGVCLALFIAAWAVVRLYSTTAAVVMTCVALVIPPIAAIVPNAGEELEAVTALAGGYQVPWELSDLVRRTYRRALARYGPVDGELLAVALLEEEAGHKLRPRNS
jgi:hypothetical protein